LKKSKRNFKKRAAKSKLRVFRPKIPPEKTSRKNPPKKTGRNLTSFGLKKIKKKTVIKTKRGIKPARLKWGKKLTSIRAKI